MKNHLIGVLTLLSFTIGFAHADTRNGNDFALFFSEATTTPEKKELFLDAKGKPHYFRYLLIMEMDDSNERAIAITAKEPASLMNIEFVVTKKNSLLKLSESPASVEGTAIAVTGVISSITKDTITFNQVIVRNKDRLSPKPGKEMFYEVDASGTFYSYTGGKRPISLKFHDRDLLERRDEIMGQYGKNGWAEFLEKEVAKRNAERAAKAKAEKEARKAAAEGTTQP